MIADFLSKLRIKAYDTLNDTINFLIQKYKTDIRSFSYSSPFGQILIVLQNHMQNIYYYITDSANQTNFHTANRQSSVYGLARLQGYNAYRGKSATGVINLKVKPDAKTNLITGNRVFIPNYSKLTCLQNGLVYMLDLGKDYEIFDIQKRVDVSLNIIEGKLEYQSFTGTGEDIQSYEVHASQWNMFDNDFVIVTVNGKEYPQYDSLYDIPYGECGCLVKTGMTSGIDIIFGKSSHNEVPALGAEIRVDYITTSGSVGNVFEDTVLFSLNDTCFDTYGNEINMSDIFVAVNEINPSFGADSEPMEMTKILAPNISRNFVIHDKRTIENFFRRMNYFSLIDVFKREVNHHNEYSVVLVPKLKSLILRNEDYFDFNTDHLFIKENEKEKLINTIKSYGNKSLDISISIVNPEIRRFVVYLYVELFREVKGKPTDFERVQSDIRHALSSYLLDSQKLTKITHSDIVSQIDGIVGVDSVKVVFVPEYEGDVDEIGNISLKPSQIAVLRGGFTDSQGISYKDTFTTPNEMSSVNIAIEYSK